jgi:hypothetical protein
MLKNNIDFLISSDPKLGALNKSADGSTFSIRLDENGLGIPRRAQSVTLEVLSAEMWYNTSNITTKNNQIGVTSGGVTHLLSIEAGLYSIDTLQSGFERAIRATSDTPFINSLLYSVNNVSSCYINFVGNQALNKVEINITTTASNTIRLDFGTTTTLNSMAELLGFDKVLYQVNPSTTTTLIGPITPTFNSFNYYLIQSNMVSNGLRINATYQNIIAKIRVTCSPNQQNIYDPMNPTVNLTPELAGDVRNQFTFTLLDSNLNYVDTKNEFWSATVRLTYFT